MSVETPTGKTPESHNGTTRGYLVQARSMYGSKVIGKQIFTDKWQQVQFDQVPLGVGVPAHGHHPELMLMHVYTYPGAQALRYWFLANIEPYWGLETRLIECRIEYRCEKHIIGPIAEETDKS